MPSLPGRRQPQRAGQEDRSLHRLRRTEGFDARASHRSFWTTSRSRTLHRSQELPHLFPTRASGRLSYLWIFGPQSPSRNLWRTIRAFRRTERRREAIVQLPRPTCDSIRSCLSSRGTRQHLRSSPSLTTDVGPPNHSRNFDVIQQWDRPEYGERRAPRSCIGRSREAERRTV
jgi:hypothetical protein